MKQMKNKKVLSMVQFDGKCLIHGNLCIPDMKALANFNKTYICNRVDPDQKLNSL